MNKKLFFMMMMAIFLFGNVYAITLYNPSNIYVEVNKSYPLVLVRDDPNVYNITLWVEENLTWYPFNFTWTGTTYNLSIAFTNEGNYPFVVNSTEVAGEITGTFIARVPFNVTFKFFKDKASTIFSSNKYINNYAYLTAESTGTKTMYSNNYDPNLELFFGRLTPASQLKPVFHAPLINGEATLSVFEEGEYALRLIDGEVNFVSVYSVPNVTKSYGLNTYVGKFELQNASTYNILLSDKDLHPYRWLFNWIYIILVALCIIGSVFLFFILPEFPLLSLGFGIGFTAMLTLARVIIFLWKGY